MIQKNIRDYNNQEYSKDEGSEIIKELDDRTKSDLAGYNSIGEVGAKTKELTESFEVLNTEGIKSYPLESDLPSAVGLLDGVSARVYDEPVNTNNGIYRVTSEAWVNTQPLVKNIIEESNTSTGVSGKAVHDALNGILDEPLTDGFYINRFNGNVEVLSFNSVSDFIDVTDYNLFKLKGISQASNIVTYNAAQEFIEGFQVAVDTDIDVKNVSFVIYSVANSQLASQAIYLEGYKLTDVRRLSIENSVTAGDLSEKLSAEFISENKFNAADTSQYQTHISYVYSNFIKVKPGDVVRRSFGGTKYWFFYDINKVLIRGNINTGDVQTVLSGEYFIKSLVDSASGSYSTFQISLNESIPSVYIPFLESIEPFRAGEKYSFPQLDANKKIQYKNIPNLSSVTIWNGKKATFLGDSIIRGFIPRNVPEYPGTLNSFASLTCDVLGLSFLNFGSDGSTITNILSDGSSMVERYSAMDDAADLVVIMGGTNDARQGRDLGVMGDTTAETYYGALDVLCLGLIDKYHNSQIGVNADKKQILFLTPPKFGTTYGQLHNGATIQDYGNAVKEVCNYYSIPVFNMERESEVNPHIFKTIVGTETGYTDNYNPFITDGIHPTQEGHQLMANRFIGFLKQLG